MILACLFKKGINNILIIFYPFLRSKAFLFRFSKKFDKWMLPAIPAGIRTTGFPAPVFLPRQMIQ